MATQPTPDTGMELRDLFSDHQFRYRELRTHEENSQAKAFLRLARVFAESPQTLLQELVEIAIAYCGADSAGISLEDPELGRARFRWIAVAGSFGKFLNGTTPRFFSPCGTTLDRGRPQLYRVTEPYYRYLGIEAAPINDGILIPWEAGDLRGTIWAVSHGSKQTFDFSDFTTLQGLADFAAIAVRHHGQQEVLREKEKLAAFGAAAHCLAHDINNPLQALTNILYLARHSSTEGAMYLEQATGELDRLSEMVRKILARDPIVREAVPAKMPPGFEHGNN